MGGFCFSMFVRKTVKAKRTAKKDNLIYPLLYFFRKYLLLSDCKKSVRMVGLNDHGGSGFCFTWETST